MLCARLESVASMLEARSAAVGEAQLRAILHEHQSALEAQQLAQDLPISPHISPISPHISRSAAARAGPDADPDPHPHPDLDPIPNPDPNPSRDP